MSGQLIGLDLTGTHASAERAVGSFSFDKSGKGYVYVAFGATHAAGDFILVDGALATSAMTVTTSGAALQFSVAVALFATSASTYGWVQVFGLNPALNVATGAVVTALLNSTATAGRIDDDGTTGAEVVTGVTIAATAASNTAAGFLNYPKVGRTL